jgi:putative transposase
LEADYDINVSKEVIQRLHRLWELRLLRSTRAPKPSQIRRIITETGERSNLVAQLAEIELCQVVYTDFTELRYANGVKKAYLMPILEHSSKVVFGWAVAENANTVLALQAWKQARICLQSYGLAYQDMIMHHDQDSVYTSYTWTGQLLLRDHVRLSYALNGAKDNTVMESFNGHFKPENHSLFLDAVTLDELKTVVDERMHYYNNIRLHSSLGYLTPLAFLQQELDATRVPNGMGE